MRSRWCAAIVAVAVATASCSINPVKMQPPELGRSSTVDVVIEFTNALNLPLGAKVTYQGGDVGSVRAVSLVHGTVAVDVSLNGTVEIPDDCNAAIVQDTILGDSYISLTPPPSGSSAHFLTTGTRIPASHTTPPSSIEDMMKTVATFLGTGSFQQLQNALQRINAALPKTPQATHKVADVLATDLRSIATHSAEMDRSLDDLDRLSATLHDRAPSMDDFGSEASVAFWDKITYCVGGVLSILPAISALLVQGYWLIPVFDSVAGAMEQVGVQSGGEIDTFTNQTLMPFLSNPRVDITQVVTADGQDRTADAKSVLTNLGGFK